MAFECKKCGACCRHVGKVKGYKRMAKEDGSCMFLDGNLCSIYEDRPDVCRSDRMYERYFAGRMSREEFDRATEEACRSVRDG
jgi:hypothetical protein